MCGLYVSVCTYVNIHSCGKSGNGLFICWNAGQLGIVGFDRKDSQYINDSLFLLFIRMFHDPSDESALSEDFRTFKKWLSIKV